MVWNGLRIVDFLWVCQRATGETGMTNKLLHDEPLSLTVHSLPIAQDSTQSQRGVAGGRWKLVAIVVLCSLPVLASYLAYFVVRPKGQAGYGELIEPVRPIAGQTGVALDGRTLALASLKGQWLLVSVGNGNCDSDCQQRLFLQRQLRETLGKHKDRVDWVWLVRDTAPVDPAMKKPLADAIVLRVDQATLGDWLLAPSGRDVSEYLFVVDPLGNTMMRFPSHFDGAGAAKARLDLDRLLRASLTWDTPGR
jgi:hypothetical protein